MSYILEICAGSVRSVLAANAGGAGRIELCDNLAEGGTTPSLETIRTCMELSDIPVYPIIRPRGGDFVYSEEEFEVMKQDMISCREIGCHGAVFGILLKDGTIDTKRCAELISLSPKEPLRDRGLEFTFHRAFDHCADRKRGLEELISLGFKRVLTSGAAEYAEDALDVLRDLVLQAGGRIIVMPGSGITEKNLQKIVSETGAVEFHSTAKKRVDDVEGDYPYETDEAKVRKMKGILENR